MSWLRERTVSFTLPIFGIRDRVHQTQEKSFSRPPVRQQATTPDRHSIINSLLARSQSPLASEYFWLFLSFNTSSSHLNVIPFGGLSRAYGTDSSDFNNFKPSEFVHRMAIEKQILEDSFDSLDDVSETESIDLESFNLSSVSTMSSSGCEARTVANKSLTIKLPN